MQVCVEAAGGTDGPGLRRILRQVSAALATEYAVVSDVDLIGDARESLLIQGHDVRVLAVSDLVRCLDEAEQIVWATVFLCRSKRLAEDITGAEDFISALGKADGLVRVVDASYYYVYGPVARMGGVRAELLGEEKEGYAQQLDFPE